MRSACCALRPCGSSEPSRAAAQPSGAIAISEPMAAAARGSRAVIDLIIGAAVVGTNKVAVVVAAMVLKLARQHRHRGPTVLRDRRRVLRFGPSVGCRTCRSRGDEQRRYPNQRLHPAISIRGVVVADSMAQLAENLKSHVRSARQNRSDRDDSAFTRVFDALLPGHHRTDYSAATPNGSSRPWNASDSPTAGSAGASSCSRTRNHSA
jgi:hypothetical protein